MAGDTRDMGSIPGLEGSLGAGNGNPLQCSCLENPMDRGAWQATVHGVARVGHNLVTQPPPPIIVTSCFSHQSEWPPLETLQIANAGEDVEKSPPTLLVGM